MTSFTRMWQPPLTHIVDDTTGRTLCGITPGDDWEAGEYWEQAGELADVLVGCIRCSRAAEARARRAAGDAGRPSP